MPPLLQLYGHPDIWNKDNIRRSFMAESPHREAEDILLRFSDTSDTAIGDQLQCSWTEDLSLLPSVKDMSLGIMGIVRGEQLGRVMLTRLSPGRRIYPHADTRGKYANFYTRFHVPLVSDPGVIFSCAEESVNMEPGEVWWFNGHLPHQVVNNSARDRINLIVDIKT